MRCTCLPAPTQFTLICEQLNKHGPFSCVALAANKFSCDHWLELTTEIPLRARELHFTIRMTGYHWKFRQTINDELNDDQKKWAKNVVATIDRTFTSAVSVLFTTKEQINSSALYGCVRPFLAAFQNPNGRSTVRCLQFNFEGLPLPWADPPRRTTTPPLNLRAHGADTLWFIWPSEPSTTTPIESNGFCDFLDALGNVAIHFKIEKDPDPQYTRLQLHRQRCKRKQGETAPPMDSGPATFWAKIQRTATSE